MVMILSNDFYLIPYCFNYANPCGKIKVGKHA